MKKKVVLYGQVLLSSALILYLISVLDWERIKLVLPQLSHEYVGYAFLLLFLAALFSAVRWDVLLKRLEVRQRALDSWRYYMISMFYGSMLPGIIGGDVVRLGLSIKHHGMTMKGVLTASILFDRICGFIALLAIFTVMASFVPAILGNEGFLGSSVYILPPASIIGFILILVLLKKAPEGWFAVKVDRQGWLQSLGSLMQRFRELSAATLSLMLALSLLVYLLDIVGSYFLSRALHIDVPFLYFLIIIPITYVVTALPISLGGLGVREGVLTFFLVKVGVIASDAVLLAFLIYLTWLAVALIGGIVQLMGRMDIDEVKI